MSYYRDFEGYKKYFTDPGDLPYFDKAIGLYSKFPEAPSPEDDPAGFLRRLKDTINTLKKEHAADPGQLVFRSVDNLARSRMARDRLRPELERLRLELFKKPGPPFRSIALASAWLEKESRADEERARKETEVQRGKIGRLDKRLRALVTERNQLFPRSLRLVYEELTLDVWKPFKQKRGGAFYPFLTYPGTRLRKLHEEIEDLAAKSGFTERALLFWILADVAPFLVPVTFIIRGPVTAHDLVAMFKSLKKAQPVQFSTAPKKLSQRNVEVLRFIKKLGGPPSERVMRFWREAREAWNKAHREDKFTSRDGLKKAYERARRRLAEE